MRRKGFVSFCACTMTALFLLTNLSVVAVETDTFHGNDETRTGYYDVQTHDVVNNEKAGSTLSPLNQIASPVTALSRTGDEWYQPNYWSQNKEYVFISSETVLTVYRITQTGYPGTWQTVRELVWSYTFKTPIVGTPVVCNLDPGPFTEPKAHTGAIFIVTKGNYRVTTGDHDYEKTAAIFPEMFLFQIETGWMILHYTIQYDDATSGLPQYRVVTTSPAYLRCLHNDDDYGHFFYFIAVDARQEPTRNIDFVRTSIVWDIDEWKWSSDGINPIGANEEPFKIYQNFESPLSMPYDYTFTSPAIVYGLEYRYNNNQLSHRVDPYVVYGDANTGKLYLFHYDKFDINDQNPECWSKKIIWWKKNQLNGFCMHSSPSVYISKTRSMILPRTPNDFGTAAYIDMGIEAVGPNSDAYLVRFILFLDIKQQPNGEWTRTLRVELVNDVQIESCSYATSTAMLLGRWFAGYGYAPGIDESIYREFIIGWSLTTQYGPKYTVLPRLLVIKAEGENEQGLADPVWFANFGKLSLVKTVLGFESYQLPYKPPNLPAPVCTDDYVFYMQKNKLTKIRIETNGGLYTDTYTNPSVVKDLGSISFTNPALSNQYYLVTDGTSPEAYSSFQIVVYTIDNYCHFLYTHSIRTYSTEVDEDYGYLPKSYEDHQWSRFHRGMTVVQVSTDPPRYTSEPGHLNWYVSTDSLTYQRDSGWDDVNDPVVSSPITVYDDTAGVNYVISAQKNIIACFFDDLEWHSGTYGLEQYRWRIVLNAPIVATPLVVKDFMYDEVTHDEVDILVVVTNCRRVVDTSIVDIHAAADSTIHLIKLEDGVMINSYTAHSIFGPGIIDYSKEIMFAKSSPLYKKVLDIPTAGDVHHYLFQVFHHFEKGTTDDTIDTYLCRFEIEVNSPSIQLTLKEYYQYESFTGRPVMEKYSYSSPIWVKYTYSTLTREWTDEGSIISVGSMWDNGGNLFLAYYMNFGSYHLRIPLGLEGEQPNIRFSTPTTTTRIESIDAYSYVCVGTDRGGTEIPPRIHQVSIEGLGIPSLWVWPPSYSFVSQDLGNDLATSPTFWTAEEYVFITATDNQLSNTKVYMLKDPIYTVDGEFDLLDTESVTPTNPYKGKPAEVVATGVDIYVPIGDKIKIAEVNHNQETLENIRDFSSFTAVKSHTYWSATLAFLTIDTSIHTYCTNSIGEMRRWS